MLLVARHYALPRAETAGVGVVFGPAGAWAGLALPALWLPIALWTIRHEEAVLAREFGAAFGAYRAGTARLVPFVW